MNTSLQYIEQALALGQEELAALMQGDVEEAMELAERREAMAARAWELRTPSDNQLYSERILQMMKLQERLSEAARTLKEEIRVSLVKSRKEGQRLAGYRKAVAHAL